MKTRQQIAKQYGTEVRPIRDGESKEQYFRSLVKQANTRIDRLEALSQKEGYTAVKSFAYSNAMYDIKALSGNPNAEHFSVKVKRNKDGSINQTSLDARINAVKRFLEAPTSTKTGIDKIYQQRADKINARNGTDFTWKELAQYFSKETFRKKDSKVGSDVMLKAVAAIRNITTPAKVQAATQANAVVSDDQVVNEVAKNLLNDGLTFKDFV